MIAAWAFTIALAIIHFIANRVIVLRNIPRSIWLSVAGGASIAYIFLHLLPELNSWQFRFDETVEENWWSGHYLYLLSLTGLTIFYGLERLAKQKKASSDHSEHARIFWLHITTYFIYNFIVGYLLVSETSRDMREALFFFIAMALHFVVNDFSLLQDHQERYVSKGRWIVSGSVLLGAAIASLISVSDHLLMVLFGLVSGTVILNVLKEELPEERKSKYWAFVTGAVTYGLLLMLTEEK